MSSPPMSASPKWFAAFLVAVVAGLAFLLASFPARNADVWMHLVSGRDLVHGAPPAVAYLPEQFAEEMSRTWLYDVAVYGMFTAVGPGGLVFVKALVVAALALLLLELSRGQHGLWLAAACTVLAVLVLSTRVLLQPATVSYLLFGVALGLAWREQHRGETGARLRGFVPPWPLIVLFIVWANVDGRFVLGLGILGLLWIGEALDGRRPTAAGAAAASRFELGFGAALARIAVLAAACLVNPHHVHAFAWPEELGWFAATQRLPVSPLNRAYLAGIGLTPAGLAYYPLLGLGLVSFALAGQWRWRRFLPWAAAALVSLTNARAIPLFAVVGGPVLSWNLQAFFARRAVAEPPEAAPPEAAPWRRGVLFLRGLTVLLGLTFVVAAWPGWLHAPPFEPRRFAIETAPALQQGALVVCDWHEQGKLPPQTRSLHLTPDTFYAFRWFCPQDPCVLAAPLFASVSSPEEQRARMRDAGVNRFIVYDADRDRLMTVLDQLLADPRHWPLLALSGDVALFGWRDPDGPRAGAFAGAEMDVGQLAFDPRQVREAPPAPGDALDERRWWDALYMPAPPRALDRDEAMLHLAHAESLGRSAPQRHVAAWDAAGAAGLIALNHLVPPLDLQLRLALVQLPAPEPGRGIDSLPGIHQFAHAAAQQFAFQRDDTQPALLYLAVRAARRAVAVDPRDGQAHRILGESYLRLLGSTRERAWAKVFPQLGDLRRIQASAALNQAALLQPRDARVQRRLFEFYAQVGCWDLAHDHLRRHRDLVRQASGPPETLAALEEQLERVEEDVAARTKAYEAAVGGLRVFDRANLALRYGLAGRARDQLLESNVAAFGAQGLELELELLLRTGRAETVREWADPDHKDALGALPYHWLRARAFMALGDYAAARGEVLELEALGRHPIAPAQRVVAGLVAKQILADQPVGMQVPHLLLRGLREAKFRDAVGHLLGRVRQQADANVLLGLVTLEQGDVEEADVRFRLALSAWQAGRGVDFAGRDVAEGCLAWLE